MNYYQSVSKYFYPIQSISISNSMGPKDVNFYELQKFRQKIMNSMSKTQKFFTEFDMFSAPPILRARKQPDTSSYTSGILSFLLGLFFLYVFVSKIIEVVMYQQIQSVQTQSKLNGDDVKADNVFFGVNVGYLPINQSVQLFDIGILATHDNGTDFMIQLQQCKQEQWISLGDNYQTLFNQYKLSNYFCPVDLTYLYLRKTYYAPNSKSLKIYVKPCTDGANCIQNMTEQLQKVKELQQVEGSIFMTIYFLDNLISPNQKNAMSKTINTDSQFSFTMKRGIIATIQLGTHRIQTDSGYFPVSEMENQEGNFLFSFRETSYEISNQTQNYALLYVTMNRKMILLQRTVGKFDEMLSYAGGLFSIIVGFLKIFMFSYNQYRYELMVAEGICQNDDDGNHIRQQDLNFFRYIKYTIFDWIQVLFCHQVNWEDCKLIDKAREEANSVLDVTNLFKKIKGFESALQHLLDENEKDCLFLVKPNSLDQTKRDRLILEYYSVIMKDDPAITISEYYNAKSIYHFAIKIQQKSLYTAKSLKRQVSNDYGVNGEILDGIPEDMIDKKEYTTEEILQLFPEIFESVMNIKLDKEMEEVQNELVEAYFNLKPQKMEKIEWYIPIKILIRLRAKRCQLDKQMVLSDVVSLARFSSFKY